MYNNCKTLQILKLTVDIILCYFFLHYFLEQTSSNNSTKWIISASKTMALWHSIIIIKNAKSINLCVCVLLLLILLLGLRKLTI